MPERWEREIDELLRRREAKLRREPVSRRVVRRSAPMMSGLLRLLPDVPPLDARRAVHVRQHLPGGGLVPVECDPGHGEHCAVGEPAEHPVLRARHRAGGGRAARRRSARARSVGATATSGTARTTARPRRRSGRTCGPGGAAAASAACSPLPSPRGRDHRGRAPRYEAGAPGSVQRVRSKLASIQAGSPPATVTFFQVRPATTLVAPVGATAGCRRSLTRRSRPTCRARPGAAPRRRPCRPRGYRCLRGSQPP